MTQVQQKDRAPCGRPVFSFHFRLLSLFVLLNAPCPAQVPRALQVLKENKTAIYEAARSFRISPRVIASVIYVEHAKNVSWMDRDVDPLLAHYGMNVSLGLGQVKINTALWIEKSLHDSSSKYYPGREFSPLIPRSASREGLIERLFDPSWNTKYIAAYMVLVQHRWRDANVDIENQVEILATLYSAGVVEGEKEKRPPHNNPIPNNFGKLAKAFYDSHLEVLE